MDLYEFKHPVPRYIQALCLPTWVIRHIIIPIDSLIKIDHNTNLIRHIIIPIGHIPIYSCTSIDFLVISYVSMVVDVFAIMSYVC